MLGYKSKDAMEGQVCLVFLGAIGEMGEVAMKDFGKIMGAVMAEVKGRAGGDMVKRIIEEEMKSLNM